MMQVNELQKSVIFGAMNITISGRSYLGGHYFCVVEGVARKLLDVLVEFAREKQLKIVPTCSYVEVMFKRDQSFADVVA